MKLEIKNLVGERCVTSEDGQRLYDEIYPKLAAGESVCLDFEDVKVFASPFFNFGIGQLLKDLKPEDLNELLKVEGLGPDGALVWQRVVKNAKEYYKNPGAKRIIDEILKEQAEDE
jgi:hypothetical protein